MSLCPFFRFPFRLFQINQVESNRAEQLCMHLWLTQRGYASFDLIMDVQISSGNLFGAIRLISRNCLHVKEQNFYNFCKRFSCQG